MRSWRLGRLMTYYMTIGMVFGPEYNVFLIARKAIDHGGRTTEARRLDSRETIRFR